MSLSVSLFVLFVSFVVMSETIDRLFMPSLDRLAKQFKLSDNVAGATLLAIGTSMPEISTAMVALFVSTSSPIVGVGTIIWSAIFQVLIVIGVVGLVRRTHLEKKAVLRDSIVYLFSVCLLFLFLFDWQFTLLESVLLVWSYGLYLIFLWWWNHYIDDGYEEVKSEFQAYLSQPWSSFVSKKHVWTRFWDIVFHPFPDIEKKPDTIIYVFAISLLLIGLCTYYLVMAGESTAVALGVPPVLVALTILAGWSSIPELLSAVIVTKKGKWDMAVADALGSNIFDILMSLGLPLLGYILWHGPVVWLQVNTLTDSVLLLFSTVVLFVVGLWIRKFVLGKWLGCVLVTVYVFYVLFVAL